VNDEKKPADVRQSEGEPREGKEILPSTEPPPVVPPPALQRWRMALSTTTAPFADPSRVEPMLKGLSDLLADRRANVRFSTLTGLVGILRGELYPGRAATTAEEMLAISEEFLRQREMALTGARGYHWLPETRATVGYAARFRQTDKSDIPVYGGTMVLGFDEDGQMGIVNSSWYPTPPDASYEQRFQLTWEEASEIALEYVRTHFPKKASQSKISKIRQSQTERDQDLHVIPGDDLKKGQVVFPQLDEDREVTGDPYRPAWVALVIERARSRSWEVIVDAENGQVLAAADATVRMPRDGCVYVSNSQALPPGDAKKVQFPFDAWSGAPHFIVRKIDDSTISSPPPPLSPPCGSVNPAHEGFRAGNAYHHLSRALDLFTGEIVKKAWPNALAVPKMPGEEEKMLVNMCRDGAAWYDPAPPRSISFGAGQLAPPVDDSACDCEVIYHEYAHAVLHVVQPDLFKNLPYLFKDAINEGVAFYFGCTLSERAPAGQSGTAGALPRPYRWGEFAYGDPVWGGFRDLKREQLGSQEPGYDYLDVYGVFPWYDGGCKDPTGEKYYACGMLWARALWDIRRALGYDIADAIILRGLSLTGGVQSELETPAEAIAHADRAYVQASPPHESALRLIFCSRGIMCDAPVHALVRVDLGEKTVSVAATENTAQNGSQPGCMFSADTGDTWAPLGTDGPSEVVALAVVKVSAAKAIIWAAGEHWAGDGGNVTPTAKIYRYELEVDGASGGIKAGEAWEELDDLPVKVNVLSLAAMKDSSSANEECWLFAGTERGLYKYDDSWHAGPNFLRNRPIFDLAASESPSRRLAVATNNGAFVLDPTDMGRDYAYNPGRPTDLTLSVVADSEGEGHIWAGTPFAGIYHFVPNVGWQHDDTIERPVCHLWVEKQGTEWVQYAGTNNGVYRHTGSGNWEEFNQVASPSAESIEGTSVVALCRVADRLLAGTAQRGLWGRRPAAQWVRLTDGLPRIGRLTDATVPTDTCAWSEEFTNDLPQDGVGTHVLYVPRGDCSSLSFTVEDGDVDLALYHVSPCTNPDQDLWAGLQDRQLAKSGTSWTMSGRVQRGFYLLAVMAGAGGTSYRVAVQTA
jgi:hypothetical protein